MTMMVGSARHDERGKYTGGKKGDQTGTEVSQQPFYLPAKGLYVIRAKSVDQANKLAQSMIDACDNNNGGYAQNDRYGIIKMLKKYGSIKAIKEKYNSDCSTTVRACVTEACNKDPGDFTTANEVSVLAKTGLFYDKIAYTKSTILYNGDILVTKTKGHTLIVTSGRARRSETVAINPFPVPKKILRKTKIGKVYTTRGDDVRWVQFELGFRNGDLDGIYGNDTESAVKKFQKDHGFVGKDIDGVVGPMTINALLKY